MKAVLWRIQSKFPDRYKVRRYPSNHWHYFKTRRGAVKFCVNGYNLQNGEWEMYRLLSSGHTRKERWF